MSTIINGPKLASLNVGFSKIFKDAFKSQELFWQLVATMVPSTTRENQYAWLGDFPTFREWIGDRVINELSGHSYSITNKDFEMTIGVDRNDIEDDNLGMYTPMVQSMGMEAAKHPDKLVYQGLMEGFSKACYDGQYFFDTDHPVGTPGNVTSVSNFTAGSEAPWFLMDTTRPLKPMIYQKRRNYEFLAYDKPNDESVFRKKRFEYGADGRGNVGYGFWQMAHGSKAVLETASFREARNAMTSLTNDNGDKLGIRPNILVVGSSNADAARDLIEADRLANGATNTDKNLVKVHEVPWLD